jgi:hypothetical protein
VEEVRRLGRVHAPWYFEAMVHQRLQQTRTRSGFRAGWAMTLVVLLGAAAAVFFFNPFGLMDRLPEILTPVPAIVDSSQSVATPVPPPDSAGSGHREEVATAPGVRPSEAVQAGERTRSDRDTVSTRRRRRPAAVPDSSSTDSTGPARRPTSAPADSATTVAPAPRPAAPPDTL